MNTAALIAERRSSLVARLGKNGIAGVLEHGGPALILIPLVIFFGTQNDRFLSVENWLNLLRQISIFAILGVGMTILMITANIDLSIGSVTAFTGIVAVAAFDALPGGMLVAFVCAILTGATIGAFNGLVTLAFGVPSLLVTLGTLQLIRGLGLAVTNGSGNAPHDPAYLKIGIGYLLGVPYPVWILLAVVLVGWLFLSQSRRGQHVYAVGGNPEAARRSSISVRGTTFMAFVIMGGLAGLTGTMLSSRLGSGQPNVGIGYELLVIAAVVLGGTSLFGGKGTIVGSLFGALVIGVLQNGMDLMAITPFWQMTAVGALIVFALVFDAVRYRQFKLVERWLREARER